MLCHQSTLLKAGQRKVLFLHYNLQQLSLPSCLNQMLGDFQLTSYGIHWSAEIEDRRGSTRNRTYHRGTQETIRPQLAPALLFASSKIAIIGYIKLLGFFMGRKQIQDQTCNSMSKAQFRLCLVPIAKF